MRNFYGRIRSRIPSGQSRSNTATLSGYRKVILHAGFHKTGTSYIQTVMRENRGILGERGIEYPLVQRASNYGNPGNHSLIAKKYELSSDVDGAFRDFSNVGNQHPTLLVSGESFSQVLRKNGFLESFLEATSGAEVRFVFYLRRQDELYESTYAQTVKKMVSGDIYGTSFHHDFSTHLQPFVDAVGTENITLRPYNRKLWPGGELGADFCAAIGEPDSWKQMAPLSDSVVNASLNRNQVFLLSQLEDQRSKKSLRTYLEDHPDFLPGDGVRYFMTPEERRGILARYAEPNQKIADTFDLGDMNEFLGIDENEEDSDWRPYEPDWELLARHMILFMDESARSAKSAKLGKNRRSGKK